MAAAVFASFAMVACGTDNGSSEDKKYEAGYKIVLDEPLEFGAEIDYAAEISLPGAVVKDKNGEIVSYDIEYRITDSENKTISSEYSSFALKPGEYTVTYYYSSMLSLDIKFKVVDRVAPAISFRNVPNDLFVGVDENGFLPLVDIDDASAVETEVKLEFATFGGEKHEVEYSKMADSFAVTEPGVFTFTVTATDASGNKTTESVTWLAKDPGWTDSALEDGLYSDFGEEAYLNTVKAGDVNKYWTVSDYTQGWLENYEGASGVLKLGLSFTDTQNTSVAVKLAKPIKWSDLKGKYILARVYVEGDGLENYFGFAGNQKIQFADELSAATEKKSPLVTGKWTTYALDCDRAVALRMYSDENDDKDNPSSDVKQIQFCFTRSDKSLARMYLYLDGISVAEKLPAAENVKAENGVLAWNAVENASGYRVNVNGTETVTDKTQITLTETKGYAFVTALGNEKTYTESDKSFAVFGLEAKDGEYASFDDPLYEYFVGDDVKVGSETAGYKPTSVSVKYDETNRKLTATVGKGGWGICTALAMRFPRKVDVSEVKTIALGMTADVAGMCNEIAVYDYDYTKQLGKIVIEEGVTRYFIDVSEMDELGGLQFVYQNKIDGSLQDMGDRKITFDFDFIAPAVELGAPEVAVDNASKTISWNAVENAVSYAIVKDGETIDRTTELSYDCSDTGEFTTLGVMAEGTGRFLSGAVGYAEITLDGTDWIEVKGMLTVAKIAWATKDLIQLEFSSGTEYAANAALKADRFALTINGKKFTVTGVVTTDVSTKIVVNGDFSALKKGDVLVVGAKTTLNANGVVYGLTESYTAIFAGEAGDGYGTYNWCAFAGELSLAKTDWSSAGVIQIVFNTIKEADQTVFDASGIKAYASGSAMSFTEIRWHQSVNKLALSFGQPGADATYGVPVITIKGGSVITAAGRAYVFDKDYMFAYSSVHDRWSLVSSPETVSLSWPENSSSLQLKFDRDLWDGEMTVDASRMNVLSNGVKVDVTALKDSPAHIRVQGAFSTQTAEGYDVPTLVIKAGSLAMLHNTSVLFAEDVTFVWNGTAWTMA